ncbi:hypothetical protein GOV12_06500 [Candidatus Pacearchaeota archaeon]|nr:hypothetical protein [Candidatus Pacearchaeota archaeon]
MNNMCKISQKPVIFGKVSIGCNVVSNVVCKKCLKKSKKTSKIGKVRVRKGVITNGFSKFLLKSEIFCQIGKRERYLNLIFNKKVSYGG